MIANWVHTISPKTVASFAPFYHFNQADYDSLASDQPVSTTWHQESNYGGAQSDWRTDLGVELVFRAESTHSYRGKTIYSVSR
ncbi:MAG: hypothetical protein WDM87_00075 [Terracidiphilus sp.]